MNEDQSASERQPGWRAILRRLSQARWMLAGAAVVVIVLGASHSVPSWAIGIAVAALAVIAAIAPAPSSPSDRRTAKGLEPAGFGTLSAESLADAVPDPLVILDESGTALHVNRAARSAFNGLRAGTSLVLRFRAPEMQALIEGLMISGQSASIDYSERVPVERWFKVTGAPVGREAGLYVLVFKDQSEARRIDRMRADFIANASHELRTPLASISGFIETLRGPARNDAAAREQFLQIMQNQTGRMARLIDDLLSLSRLEMKPYLDPAEQVDLRLLIEGVADALKPLAAESGVKVSIDVPPEPALVAGSRDELIQVFENLLENACKYGQSGGAVDVAISRPDSGSVEVTVRDYGPGIPKEHIPRLTERFYRVDVETSRGQKGTGLGLAIVKHILTRHHARLTIRSEPGEGAAFIVNFPAA